MSIAPRGIDWGFGSVDNQVLNCVNASVIVPSSTSGINELFSTQSPQALLLLKNDHTVDGLGSRFWKLQAVLSFMQNTRGSWLVSQRTINVAVTCMVILIGMLAYYCYEAYLKWKKHFHPIIEINKDYDPTCYRSTKGQIPTLKTKWNEFVRGGLLNRDGKYESSGSDDSPNNGVNLRMDRKFLTYSQFLWSYFFIYPNMILGGLVGTVLFLTRNWLRRHKIWTNKGYDASAKVAELLLETMNVIHFVDRETIEGDEIGHFEWIEMPIVTNDGKMEIFDTLSIDISLSRRRFIKANYVKNRETRNLSAADVVIVLFYNAFAAHPASHGYAPWGVDLKSDNIYLERYAIATTIYNNYGWMGHDEFLVFMHQVGVLPQRIDFKSCAAHYLKKGVHVHDHLRTLPRQYSELNFFILAARKIFLEKFRKYRKAGHFKHVHPESMFIGSIIHSLDHVTFGNVISDASIVMGLSENRQFDTIALLANFISSTSNFELPCMLWNRFYRNSEHPFFREVYDAAKVVNKRFADDMETCIIR